VRPKRILFACSLAAISIATPRPARAWDSATHRAIARLAVEALPPSPLKTTLAQNESALELHAVEPDTVLKEEYGEAEKRRHYIDVEYFGNDPWPRLNPDINAMRRRFGSHTLDRAGTLPWTIESVSNDLESAWRQGDCADVIRLSGYLAHYIGDASQPLHSTMHYDGYEGDRGVHARVEAAVDHSLGTLEPAASREVRIEEINDVWSPAIAEIRDANGLIGELIRDDRAARDQGDFRGGAYEDAMMREDAAMFERQIARASSVLASIWMYEWRRAGSPVSCEDYRDPAHASYSHRSTSYRFRKSYVHG
jgi:hypothetical protein